MTSSTSNSDRLARALAVASPLVVLSLGLSLLLGPASRADAPLQGAAAQIASSLEETQPRVLVVGNSLARRGLDLAVVAQTMGVSSEEIMMLYVGGSRMPVWYAALKRQVFEAGYRPEAVIIAASPRWLLSNDLSTENVDVALRQILRGEHEPAIARIRGDETNPYLQRLDTRRGALRDALLGGVRAGVGRLVFGLEPVDTTARIEALFSEENLRLRAATRVIPSAEAEAEAEADTAPKAVSVADSLLEDVTQLVQSYGAKLIVLQLPVSDGAARRHALPEEEQRALVSTIHSRGAGFIDLTALDIPPEGFSDTIHANALGRKHISRAAQIALAAIGAPLGQPLVPPDLSALRLSTLQPVVHSDAPSRKQSRWGDAPLWLLPGGRLSVPLLPDVGSLAVDIQASAHGRGRADLTMSAGGVSQPLSRDRRMLHGHLELTPGPDDTLNLEVPTGSPAILIHRLSINNTPIVLLSDRRVDLLAEARVTGAPPSPLPAPFTADGAVGILSTAVMQDAYNDVVAVSTDQGCTPFEVVADGAVMPLSLTHCRDFHKNAVPLTYCARNGRAWFRPEQPPSETDSYGLALRADRQCGSGRWLYPGDTLLVEMPDSIRAAKAGSGSLLLSGRPVGEGPWDVSVTWMDHPVLEAQVTAAELKSGAVRLPLMQGLPPLLRKVSVSIAGEGALYVSAIDLTN